MQRSFNLLVMGSLVGIAWGTLLFILAPRLGQWRGDRKLVRNLAPVGARMRELYPSIALGASADHPTTAIRAQRLVIEIGDGLRLLPVASGQHHSAAQVIADAMRSDRHMDTGYTASDLLSASQSRREEYEMLQDIASKFRRRVQS